MPFYRLCQVKMLKKHGRASWRDDEGKDPLGTLDGHDEAELRPTRMFYTKTQRKFYGWRYLWGLPFRWRKNLSRRLATAVGCGSSWNAATCQESDLDMDTMHFLTPKLGPTTGVQLNLRLWAARTPGVFLWQERWQLFWELFRAEDLNDFSAESLTTGVRSYFDAKINDSKWWLSDLGGVVVSWCFLMDMRVFSWLQRHMPRICLLKTSSRELLIFSPQR